MKSLGLTKELHLKLSRLSMEGENGIPGVRVKSVDIGRNTDSEGDSLVQY